MTTVRDVVSPTAFFLVRIFGYALIVAAWAIIAYLMWRACRDAREQFSRWYAARKGQKKAIAFSPALTTCRVIAFPSDRERKATHA